MATYVFSDVHGHFRPMDRLLERLSLSDEDDIWILGDMVDRGPDPVSVMRACRGLANAHVLMGNHEKMMLDVFDNLHDLGLTFQWEINGGITTARGLMDLPTEERIDYLDWCKNLQLGAFVEVGERAYILVHAGLRPIFSAHTRWNEATLNRLLLYQDKDDLLWIREDFWGQPTGFVDEHGQGPVVIAGHTPVPYVDELVSADERDRPARDDEGRCQIMHLGASDATGGVADRWAIDCGAAGGAGWGRIGMVRLDDGEEFYEDIQPDE